MMTIKLGSGRNLHAEISRLQTKIDSVKEAGECFKALHKLGCEERDQLQTQLDTALRNAEKAHIAHAKTGSELSAEKGKNERLQSQLDSIRKEIEEFDNGVGPSEYRVDGCVSAIRDLTETVSRSPGE